jgi:hypothetical protein
VANDSKAGVHGGWMLTIDETGLRQIGRVVATDRERPGRKINVAVTFPSRNKFYAVPSLDGFEVSTFGITF